MASSASFTSTSSSESANMDQPDNLLPSFSTVEPPELENIYDSDEEEGNTSENVGASETGARSKEDQANPESEKSKSDGVTPTSAEDEEKERKDSAFECNICLDVASDAVISMCGHLFCWPCLHQWLETRPHHQICPVCKAGISRDKVVPLYGRGNSDPKDPREKPIPPRPRGQRSEPETSGGGQPGFWGIGNGAGGFQMSFGIGAFPFGIFATNFNIGGDGTLGGGQQVPVGSAQYEEEQFLSKVFLWIAVAFIVWLAIA